MGSTRMQCRSLPSPCERQKITRDEVPKRRARRRESTKSPRLSFPSSTHAMASLTVPKEFAAVGAVLSGVPLLFLYLECVRPAFSLFRVDAPVTTHSIRVSSARKAAKVPYPIMYVDPEQESKDRSPQAARVFNCAQVPSTPLLDYCVASWLRPRAQRAHYNTIEQLAAFLPALLVSGVRFPLVSAGLGATWLVGRVGYTEGYLCVSVTTAPTKA